VQSVVEGQHLSDARRNRCAPRSPRRPRLRGASYAALPPKPVSADIRTRLRSGERIPPGKGSARPETGAARLGSTGPISGGRDHAIPRLQRQSHGKSKTIPMAPGNRICAGLRGGPGRTRTCIQSVMTRRLHCRSRPGITRPRNSSPLDGAPDSLANKRRYQTASPALAKRPSRYPTDYPTSFRESLDDLIF
jgi:hypothetical protein